MQRATRVFDGKWTTLVLRDLLGGTRRYSELQRSLAGISPRLLSARLKLLEQQGLVLRTEYATVPPTTEYALSEQGMRIIPVIQALAAYGQGLLEEDASAAQRRAAQPAATQTGVTRVRNGKRVS
ncbi:transcriptional regulator [Pseudoduganella sp. CY13W]|uniref:Transcriptional regulator n=1 Tax=Duganella qianjiadongensis TaxID=2692176 RepID=A0ABW9VSK6_9BURK|nr:transcriptional regulator [Duganella qianjiadongensis]